MRALARHRLVLDTTVLKLLVDPKACARLLSTVDRPGIESVFVPDFSAVEATDGTDGDDRARALVALAARSRVPVMLLADLPGVLARERSGPRRLGRTRYPAIAMPSVEHLLAVRARGEIHSWMRRWKDGLASRIVAFREEAKRNFPDRSVRDLDEMLANDEVRTTLLERESFGMAQIPEEFRGRVRESPRRYPVHALWAGLTQVFGIASGYADRMGPRWAPILGAPHRNDLADIVIAASAGAGTRLVTQDKGQAARLDFVAKALNLGVRAVGVDDVANELV
ncbi:MAG: hypothetical protein K1X94_11240 [Sandaracinaceae bacterium]|nr:hypothetical protein [Sandaracinaceae bacterium]